MAAEVHPGLPGIGKSEHDRGAVRVRSRDVFMGAKAAPPSVTRGCPAVHWQIDFLVALPPVQDLLLCAKHLFVAAMVAWVHPGPAGNRQIKYDGGEVRAAVGRGDVGRGRRPLILRGAPIEVLRPVRGVSESRAAISPQEAVT